MQQFVVVFVITYEESNAKSCGPRSEYIQLLFDAAVCVCVLLLLTMTAVDHFLHCVRLLWLLWVPPMLKLKSENPQTLAAHGLGYSLQSFCVLIN